MAATRLRQLGALPDEVAAFLDAWDDFDTDWTPERRYEFVRAPDTVLLDALLDVRDEHEYGTTDEDTAAERHDRLVAEAEDVVADVIPRVVEWVGRDRARAAAAIEAEEARAKPRTSLLSAMTRLLGG